MSMEKGKKWYEGPLKFYEKFNRFLGGVAIAGAVGAYFVAPEYAPILAAFGVLQFVEASVIKSFRQSGGKKPKPAPA